MTAYPLFASNFKAEVPARSSAAPFSHTPEALAKPLGILETGGCRRLGASRHFSDSGDFAGPKGEWARAKGLRGLREAETLRFRACSGVPACDAGLSESHLPLHAANRAT